MTGPTAKFFTSDLQQQLRARFDAKPGDLILIVAASQAVSSQALSNLRIRLAAELKLCIDRAEAAPGPAIGTMFEQVFEHMPEHLRQQQRECVEGARAKKVH